MTEFERELRQWIDQDGLIGNQSNPPKWSTGNAVLETAIAIQICKKHSAISLAAELTQSVGNCWYNKSLHKNPNRTDQITHDDLIGFASIDPKYANLICHVGVRNGWNLSNTGFNYFTSQAKPWHQSAYLAMASEYECGLYDGLILGFWLVIAAFTASSSGLRLAWLVSQSANFRMDRFFIPIFNAILKSRGKTIKQINQDYYGPNWVGHPLVKYA